VKLSSLLSELGAHDVSGGLLETEVVDIVQDSRLVAPGALFVAIQGSTADGHDHALEAVSRGAVAVLCDRALPEGIPLSVAAVRVPSVSVVLPRVARGFFGDPSRRLRIFGITGTNGKSTTTFILRSILEKHGLKTAVLGTLGYFIGAHEIEAPNTTPDVLTLNRLLATCVREGVAAVAMEVSSHALALGRVEGLRIELGLFTNLTQDHLDFHSGMDDYFAAKSRLFAITDGRGAVNVEDEAGARLKERFPRLRTFGTPGEIRAEDERLTIRDTAFTLVLPDLRIPVRTHLVGRTNIQNALAATAIALEAGIPPETIVAGLEASRAPAGRFELVPSNAPFSIAVDYAHTPDALERLLLTGRDLGPNRLLVVFGCGGDRDRTKRPKMGAIASRLADEVWITSDNPRTEDPERILDEILSGISGPVHRIGDRRTAIHEAVNQLKDGDLLVIAGKGHENYQIIGREKFPFDDKLVAMEALAARNR
jgi:UDP-N-acetylmuramoyl-L-alanyl-D-glutamate--2,6-diaminopimelate ligase